MHVIESWGKVTRLHHRAVTILTKLPTSPGCSLSPIPTCCAAGVCGYRCASGTFRVRSVPGTQVWHQLRDGAIKSYQFKNLLLTTPERVCGQCVCLSSCFCLLLSLSASGRWLCWNEVRVSQVSRNPRDLSWLLATSKIFNENLLDLLPKSVSSHDCPWFTY